jgi:hypothetical protein
MVNVHPQFRRITLARRAFLGDGFYRQSLITSSGVGLTAGVFIEAANFTIENRVIRQTAGGSARNYTVIVVISRS